jgi:hypothetical protein
MAERRTAERLMVQPDGLEYVSIEEIPQPETEREEQTQPMRLPFLALLAERDPLVQARLNLRRTLAVEAERIANEDRPTDPVLPAKGRT